MARSRRARLPPYSSDAACGACLQSVHHALPCTNLQVPSGRLGGLDAGSDPVWSKSILYLPQEFLPPHLRLQTGSGWTGPTINQTGNNSSPDQVAVDPANRGEFRSNDPELGAAEEGPLLYKGGCGVGERRGLGRTQRLGIIESQMDSLSDRSCQTTISRG